MKKILIAICVLSLCGLMACSFHGKQEKDDAYYKRTQTIGWPAE